MPLTSIQELSSFGLTDWYQIQPTTYSPQCATILGTWVSTIGTQFRLFVQRLWVKWAEKPVNLWTNMMSHLMFAFPQCYHNPRLFLLKPKWVFSFGLALPMLLQFPSHYFHLLTLLQISTFIKIRALYRGMQEASESIDVCVDDKVTNYLNRRDVQEALHAKLVGVRKWDVCSK